MSKPQHEALCATYQPVGSVSEACVLMKYVATGWINSPTVGAAQSVRQTVIHSLSATVHADELEHRRIEYQLCKSVAHGVKLARRRDSKSTISTNEPPAQMAASHLQKQENLQHNRQSAEPRNIADGTKAVLIHDQSTSRIDGRARTSQPLSICTGVTQSISDSNTAVQHIAIATYKHRVAALDKSIDCKCEELVIPRTATMTCNIFSNVKQIFSESSLLAGLKTVRQSNTTRSKQSAFSSNICESTYQSARRAAKDWSLLNIMKPAHLFLTLLLAMPCLTHAFAQPSTRKPTIALHPYNIRLPSKITLFMGKGDGKKKRKKKSTAGGSSNGDTVSSSSPSVPSPSPLRVTNSINIPIKRQIKWAKINQEIRNSGNTSFRQPKKRTAYRKQLDEESHAAMLDTKRARASHVNWDVILNHNGTSAGPLMLVDGYNVIYQWSRLKKHMLKGNIAQARDLLVRDLEELHYAKGWRIECVFDGFGRKVAANAHFDGPGNSADKVPLSERVTSVTDTGRGVRVCFSGVGASADSYIEKRCLDAKDITKGKLTGSLIVVSNDAMIKLVGASAGALCMSSDRFVDELKAVKKITQYRVEAAMAIVNGGYVRPESLRGNKSTSSKESSTASPTIRMSMQGAQGTGMNNAVGLDVVDGVQVINTYRGGQFVIEDKRLRKKNRKRAASALNDLKNDLELVNMTKSGDTSTAQTIPSWAMLPDENVFKDDDR